MGSLRAVALVASVVAALAGTAHARATASAQGVAGLPAGWNVVSTGAGGGTVWEGRIPNTFVVWDNRPSAIYLPPGYDSRRSYPVVYLLHGMRGRPSSYVDGLHIADVVDGLIGSGRARPFIVVMPVAGPRVNPNQGEWAGVWERYLVRDVVPWVDAHLPTVASPGGRALEGLCAGGFGAIDIGLRHPGIFGTLGAWEGYFAPVFSDGPFVRATSAELAAHDPTLLVRGEARQLRRAGVRFYISVGGNHGRVLRRWSTQFAQRLAALRLPHELWLLPPSERGHFWSATMPSALIYAADGFGGRR